MPRGIAKLSLSTTVVGLQESIRRIGFKESDWIILDASRPRVRWHPHPLFVDDILPMPDGTVLVVCRCPVRDQDRDEGNLEPERWFLLFDEKQNTNWTGFIRDPRTGEVTWRPVEIRKELPAPILS